MRPQLIDEIQQIFEKSAAKYQEAEAKIRAVREHVDQSRLRTRMHGPRRRARLQQQLVIARIAEGRLPDSCAPIAWGLPGRGGQCDACDGYMRPTGLMMVIPNGEDALAYLHADCYVIWRTLVHLRAALRHLNS